MLAIFKREISSFFTSATGPLALVLFLLVNGLVLWVFQGPYNVFDYGFADLSAFFMVAPFVFLILIPALSMKSFSEERKLGLSSSRAIQEFLWHSLGHLGPQSAIF